MPPYPAYNCFHSDLNRECYTHHPLSTARRSFTPVSRRPDAARPYETPPLLPHSPNPLAHITDSFFMGINALPSANCSFTVENAASGKTSRCARYSSDCSCSRQPSSPSRNRQQAKMLCRDREEFACWVVLNSGYGVIARLGERLHRAMFSQTDLKKFSRRPPISSRSFTRTPSGSLQTMLCDFYKRGELCRFGPHCWFAHGPQQHRSAEENRGNAFSSSNGHSGSPPTGHFTPEQKQWMIFSQQVQSSFPIHPRHGSSPRGRSTCFAKILGKPIVGVTGKKFESEQADSKDDGSSSQHSGPTTPTFDKTSASPSFEEAARGMECSGLVCPSPHDEVCQKDHAHVTVSVKEECPLHKYGCCPFGDECFFEHLTNGKFEGFGDNTE
ncbi:hypothetical protein Q1695_008624 [Nippostrongylus brasiliensis]|nr:hypothetical protein Q1695_008624 [Nippostrongylus brasiliensis]